MFSRSHSKSVLEFDPKFITFKTSNPTFFFHCSRQPPQLLTSMDLTLLMCKNETFGSEYSRPFQVQILCLMNHWLERTLRNHLVVFLTFQQDSINFERKIQIHLLHPKAERGLAQEECLSTHCGENGREK